MGGDFDNVGFAQEMPSDEALWDLTTKEDEDCRIQKMMKHRYRHKSPPLQLAKHSTRGPNHRPKHSAYGGRGMQAFFLDSGGRSTAGTGVFLPQTAGTNNSQQHRRSGCAPVLLPSRVVQALNLNVHALGLQLSPRTDIHKNNSKGTGENRNSSMKNKKDEEALPSCRVLMSPPRSSSPEIFLPKEWTY